MNSPKPNRPLKILMIAPTSFFNDYGGHIRILEETLTLQSRGHQITIVTYYKGKDLPGLDIYRTKALPWHAEYEVGSSRHKLAFDVYLTLKSLQVARDFKPDIVHAHMHEGALIGSLVARVSKVPLVFDFQGSLTGEMVDHHFLNQDGPLYPWVRRLEKKIDHLPQAILTSSLQAQLTLEQQFGVSSSKIHPLPDCVDTSRFNPEQFSETQKRVLKEKLGIPLNRKIVVYLGLLADYQGTGKLIETARKLSENSQTAHFLIMGYPRVNFYQAYAEELGIRDRVTLTGKIAYEEAPLYLSLGDIAISAKISSTEGSGKVLNYMAMEQPVVASDTEVHREFLGDYGLFATPGDVTSMTDCVAELLNDPARAKELGTNLRKRATEKFSWKRAGETIEALYFMLDKSNNRM